MRQQCVINKINRQHAGWGQQRTIKHGELLGIGSWSLNCTNDYLIFKAPSSMMQEFVVIISQFPNETVGDTNKKERKSIANHFK
jgi:hypothetical protein